MWRARLTRLARGAAAKLGEAVSPARGPESWRRCALLTAVRWAALCASVLGVLVGLGLASPLLALDVDMPQTLRHLQAERFALQAQLEAQKMAFGVTLRQEKERSEQNGR